MNWFANGLVLTALGVLALAHRGDGASLPLADKDVKQIFESLKSNEMLSVSISQTIFKSRLNRTTSLTGQAAFAKPNLFLWTVATPPGEQWKSDGKNLSHRQGVNGCEEITTLGDNPAAAGVRQIVDMVLNFDSLLEQFTIAKAIKDGVTASVTMTPKRNQDLTEVRVDVDTKSQALVKLAMTYKNKNISTINFLNGKRGPVNLATFAVSAPSKAASKASGCTP